MRHNDLTFRVHPIVILIGVMMTALVAVYTIVAAAPEAYGVELSDNQTKEAMPDTVVVFGNTVTNTGTLSDTILLQVSSPGSWPVALSSSDYPTPSLAIAIDLGPGAAAEFDMTVTVPDNATGATENIKIMATSVSDPTKTASTLNIIDIPSLDVFLPIVFNQYPPVPGPIVLNPINNNDGDALYTVSWGLAVRATSYVLEESTNSDFSSPVIVYQGTGTSWTTPSPRTANEYFYRVRGLNSFGYGPYSNVESVVIASFYADSNQINGGQCTVLRWSFVNVQGVFVSFGKGYDKVGVNGVDSRTVCPSVTTTFAASVVYADNSIGNFAYTVNVNNPNNICMDPYVNYFQSTSYNVSPNEKFTISWDVQCARALYLVIGNGAQQAVTGTESREVSITQTTLFKLVITKSDGSTVNASFTVNIK
ncbi:MAG: hypothetical protein M9928_03930 [Anaerolineae bacterium]|nr:hypothetical protein [Anaerolineae bacterium]MCO5192270.1 hypothetical protein [Anaerolineae bacterium]MCO5204152.1 hypothetical protein [Anaerolineae bacterium]